MTGFNHKTKSRIANNGRECSKCEKFKLWSEYTKDKIGINGHRSACKACVKLKINPRMVYQVDDFGRQCPRCEKYQPWSSFYTNKNTRAARGHQGTCKACQALINILRRYNITFENYKAMIKEQDGICAVCGQPETKKQRGKTLSLALDHNHKTGKTRALLCKRCNTVLGLIEEDLTFFEKFESYLKKFS